MCRGGEGQARDAGAGPPPCQPKGNPSCQCERQRGHPFEKNELLPVHTVLGHPPGLCHRLQFHPHSVEKIILQLRKSDSKIKLTHPQPKRQ
jgi:hypothetical protein